MGHVVSAVYALNNYVCWSLMKCGDTRISGHNIWTRSISSLCTAQLCVLVSNKVWGREIFGPTCAPSAIIREGIISNVTVQLGRRKFEVMELKWKYPFLYLSKNMIKKEGILCCMPKKFCSILFYILSV